jgi:hypothetical protein
MISTPIIPYRLSNQGLSTPDTRTSFLSGNKKEAKNACARITLAKSHLQLEKTARKTRGRSDSSGLKSFLIVNVPAKGGAGREEGKMGFWRLKKKRWSGVSKGSEAPLGLRSDWFDIDMSTPEPGKKFTKCVTSTSLGDQLLLLTM